MTDPARAAYNAGIAGADSVLVNGRPAREVSAQERGLHDGDGLFETIACLDGRPRLLTLHLERLAAGCARLGIAADLGAVGREVHALAAASARAVVKVIVTRGEARARGYAITGEADATRIALRYPWPEDSEAARHGVRVRVASLRLGENPALAGLKHCNRLEQVLARSECSDPAIAEALMFSSSGALVSGTMSNVFLVIGGRLLTPRLDRCGVAGVMRRAVLAAAAAGGIAAHECTLGGADLVQAQELFLTSALTGIRPVRELAGRALDAGPLTRQLQERLAPLLSARGEERDA